MYCHGCVYENAKLPLARWFREQSVPANRERRASELLESCNPFPFLVINLTYIPPESRMPVPVLPAELWLNILAYEDNDKCHLWFAVRRVSRDFQYYAEKILAVPTIAQASITIHVSQTQIRR